MKAIVLTQYGTPDVLKLQEVEKPAPRDNEVLVKIHASSINAADWHLLTADIFLVRLAMGLFKPKTAILGCDIAGTVEAVGKDVNQFKPGDAVFGDVFRHHYGGFAEYVAVPEEILALKPANLSFEAAAAAPLAAVTALQGLRNLGQIRAGQKVLINGASGGVGTFAIQIASYYGAEVTAVCSTRNVDLARSLGAHHVIDYTKEDFTQNGKQYDLILAANGNLPIAAYRRALTPTGLCVMTGGSPSQTFPVMFLGPLLSRKEGQRFSMLTLKPNLQDLPFIKGLLEAGKIAPVIDRRYALAETPDAFRYFGEGHAKGKVVINVAYQE